MNKLLHFIHVGKCGGTSLTAAIKRSQIVASRYEDVFISHVNGVVVVPGCDYILCLRNPIQRAISAFSWRKKLVLVDQLPDQVNRFAGEKNVLQRYESLSDLGEHLYREHDGSLSQNVARDFELIHHLREKISFYLAPLQHLINQSNLFGVIIQERFADDCRSLLGVEIHESGRKNHSKVETYSAMSDRSKANLKRYLTRDYEAITRLWCQGLINDSGYQLLLNG